MAIPWLAVLKSVPWKEVISNAPLVADGAKKLWNAVGNKPPDTAADVSDTGTTPAPPVGDELVALQSRLTRVERATAELHNQMLTSSELIKTLAEQNAELIKRVAAQRSRVAWLSGATVATGVIATLALLLYLTNTLT